MQIKCEVIEDLLPLYIDEVCSDESKRLVEEHLEGCDACSAKLNAQKAGITIDKEEIEQNLKAKNPFKKIKRRQKEEAIGTLIVGPIVVFLFFKLFNSPDVSGHSLTWTPLLYGFVILVVLMIAMHIIQLLKRKDIFTLVLYFSWIIAGGLAISFTGRWIGNIAGIFSILMFLLYPIVLLFGKGDTKRK